MSDFQNKPIRNVAVVGGGLIGLSWAIVFARAGLVVRVSDPIAEQRARAVETLSSLLAASQETKEILTRITVCSDLGEALEGAEFVQECGPEDVTIKRRIFAELDRLVPPEVVIASSTSTLPASTFTEELNGRGRCLVGHPVNPPHLVPFVEICGAPWTEPSVIEKAREIYRSVGQEPVLIRREIDGFVLNRLQLALLSEAFKLVADGVITPADLDTTVSVGLARRWSIVGPFAAINLNAPGGIADYMERYGPNFKKIAATQIPVNAWDETCLSAVLSNFPESSQAERAAGRLERDRGMAMLNKVLSTDSEGKK